MTLLVTYNTNYGSTERYARECARRHGTEAVPLEDAQVEGAEKIVVFSPNYAGQVAGAKWLMGHDVAGKKVALAIVGMTLSEEVRAKDPIAAALDEKASEITRFYLPGRLAYSELNRVHKGVMWGLNKMLKAKKNRTANEEAMYASYGTDEDRVDFAELDPIDAWLA